MVEKGRFRPHVESRVSDLAPRKALGDKIVLGKLLENLNIPQMPVPGAVTCSKTPGVES